MKSYRTPDFLKLGASVLALSCATGAGALAQDGDEEANGDVIIVRGIRQSLQASMNIKREAQGVVDAISAEDIGKFPDTNLAESLQRITGVSIERNNGEGATVTVRGFGPEFNLVTLNGRQMPTSSLGDGASPPSSRSFDFGNLASEGISGVQVYKTTNVTLPTGGIGSVLNISTTRPLEAPGLHFTAGFKGVYDTTQLEDETVTPEVSMLYSDTFADDRFGVALSGSYQERQSSIAQANIGWRDGYLGSENNWGSLAQPGTPGAANITNRPGPNDVYAVPQNGSYDLSDITRERINGQLTLQFRPIESLTGTLDYTYSQSVSEVRTNSVGIWFNHGNTSSAWTDGPVAGPIFYEEDFGAGPSDLSYSGALTENLSENESLGFNLEWAARDNLTFTLDYHDSSAESRPNNNLGTSISLGTAVFGLQTQGIDFSNDLPVLYYTEPAGVDVEDPAQRFATGNAFRNAFQSSEIQQTRFMASYQPDIGFVDSLDFGVERLENQVRSAFGFIQQDLWGGNGTAADIPDDIFYERDLPSAFSDLSGSDDPRMIQSLLAFDIPRMVQIIEGISAPCGGTGNCLAPYTTDRRIEETTTAAYFQADFGFDLFDRPANLVAGVRYEETEIDSAALVPIPIGTQWVADNEYGLIFDGSQDFTSLQGEYDYWLPAVDFDIEVREDVVLRASYSQSITRPAYNLMQGGQTVDQLFRIGGGTGSQGDPGLLPFESENWDFSAEWYYGEDSYFSIGYFHKNVENFISSDLVDVAAFSLPHPGLGARVDAAVAALGAGATTSDIRQWIFDNADPSTFNATGTNSLGFTTGQIFGVDGQDPFVNFRVNVPVNSEETAELKGWEIALQHTFGESGFGMIANYTIVDGDVEFDNTQPWTVTQFTLTGLSDSANLIGFYDKDGLQARIAYNWRDEYLAGNGPNPFYREAYGQIDANASYEFRDGLTVFVEGINLTNENFRGHRRHPNTAFFAFDGGARYMFGARYTY
ncbi:TonB-dependent receptor [Maricaulis sp. D1M11]|uniref:TonB-dependent receptor n=1 Tax=Maricaulis sp. D1M11 TaxID=3076117 RepID=UPI0039B54389